MTATRPKCRVSRGGGGSWRLDFDEPPRDDGYEALKRLGATNIDRTKEFLGRPLGQVKVHDVLRFELPGSVSRHQVEKNLGMHYDLEFEGDPPKKPRVRVFLRGDHAWELVFDERPTDTHGLMKLNAAVIVGPPEGCCWKVVGKDLGDIVEALSGAYQVDGSHQNERPRWQEPPRWSGRTKAKVGEETKTGTKAEGFPSMGRVRVWQVGDEWRVMLLDRVSDMRDQAVFGVIFPNARQVSASEFAFRPQTTGRGGWTRETVLETLGQFYEVQRGPEAHAAGSAKQAPPDRLRRAYEAWCKANGTEPAGGWRAGQAKQKKTETPPPPPPGAGDPWSNFYGRYYGTYGAGGRGSADYGAYGAGGTRTQPPPRDPPPPRPRQEYGDPYRDMLAGLPPEVLKKVYRLIAAEVHPDKGGSTETMQRVNAAWDRIKKLVGL